MPVLHMTQLLHCVTGISIKIVPSTLLLSISL